MFTKIIIEIFFIKSILNIMLKTYGVDPTHLFVIQVFFMFFAIKLGYFIVYALFCCVPST
jgi:hypothetical protein